LRSPAGKVRPVRSRLADNPVNPRVLPVRSQVSDPTANAVIVAIAAATNRGNLRRACQAGRMRIVRLQRRLPLQRPSVRGSIATAAGGRKVSAYRRSIATSGTS